MDVEMANAEGRVKVCQGIKMHFITGFVSDQNSKNIFCICFLSFVAVSANISSILAFCGL